MSNFQFKAIDLETNEEVEVTTHDNFFGLNEDGYEVTGVDEIMNDEHFMNNYEGLLVEVPKAHTRKSMPVFSGVLKYFPKALCYVAKVSKAGNDQHHPNEPLHWDRNKSTDEADALTRHLIQSGTVDDDGILHSGKMAWRALALLEKELEANGFEL